MNRNILIVLIVMLLLAAAVLYSTFEGTVTAGGNRAEQVGAVEDHTRTGPHGGRLLEDGNLAIEIVIVEAGIPPEFRVYAYKNDVLLPPDDVSVEVELTRLGNRSDLFRFVPEQDYLRGIGVVTEPHSFDVSVSASHAGQTAQWDYESYEGRTTIPNRVALESGIEVETAAAQAIVETVELTGTVQANPAGVSEVRARFSGLVTRILVDVGDTVTRGDVLGQVETNESLRSVPITAPISGLIVNRNIQVGQVTSEEALFVIANLSEVWVQLDVFGRDLGAIQSGQRTKVTLLDGTDFMGTIDYVSPLVAHGSQSIRARVPLDNPTGVLRAGQFVQATVVVAETKVPVAVREEALQTFRNFDVVYARVGDTYEVRMLGLGRRDGKFVEVLDGLQPGENYVSGNSYLIKADIEKSGASHDH
ncbi:MAG: efflux RND transporter periplasmic adaptor subunit [Woeseiaceae bacterium]|nr:efflux RND transporter periplasmic adaptor subunit [Woeseiaceae bacterium]